MAKGGWTSVTLRRRRCFDGVRRHPRVGGDGVDRPRRELVEAVVVVSNRDLFDLGPGGEEAAREPARRDPDAAGAVLRLIAGADEEAVLVDEGLAR